MGASQRLRDGTSGLPGTGLRRQPGFDVFTTAESFTVPLDFALPKGQSYAWKVRSTTAVSTVEDAAGPGGFDAVASAFTLTQVRDWQFTTAP